jgi:hypothetical protein
MKNWLIGVAILAVILGVPTWTSAHEGHAHKVMGTVATVAPTFVTVKTADGKTVMVMLDAKTKITQGKARVDATALKVGDRVVAEGPEEKAMIMATTLKLAEAAVARK